jgi:primosomal protein N' (replication factor Y)
VLVQSFAPDTPAIIAATRHDYGAFARTELPHRQAAGYPPFASMVRIVVRSESEPGTKAFAEEIARRLRDKASETIRVLGPAPAPMTKLRNQYRYHMQLQSVDGDLLRAVVRTAIADLKSPEGLFWTVDVDPWDMM